ncbi:MAG: GFA family protein [Ectothiorhodospiraceae bacterium]|jgi:hypothetical protein
MKKTYHGSCHCGAVRFEADIDLSRGTGKCNCSICRKIRNWNAIVAPDQFRLLQGEDHLSRYSFGDAVTYRFCNTCGTTPFSTGYVEAIGGDFVSVQVMCLDDATDDELAAAPVRYADGRNDAWWNEPLCTAHL